MRSEKADPIVGSSGRVCGRVLLAGVVGLCLAVLVVAVVVVNYRHDPAAEAEARELAFLDAIPPAPEQLLPDDYISDSVAPFLIPVEDRLEPISLRFDAADPRAFGRLRPRLLAHVDSRYPVGPLKKLVRSIVVCRNLKIFRLDVAGTWAPYVALVSHGSPGTPWPEWYVQRAVDHEIANILQHHHPLPEERWRALSGAAIPYGSGGVDAVILGRGGQDSMPEFLECGFINRYAAASPREDADSIASLIFSRPEQAWAWRKPYPRIWAKVMLYGEYLRSIDEEWYNAFRRSLASGRPKG